MGADSENIQDEKEDVGSPQPLSPVDRPTLNIQAVTKKKVPEE
jgi:hypothetical protein